MTAGIEVIMKKTLIAISLLTLIASCSQQQDGNGEVVSAIASDNATEAGYSESNAEALKKAEKEDKEEAASLTSMKFDKEVHDFGKIKTGTDNKCEFRVTNTGKQPLIIYNVGASCGCTTPKKPENPIPPGKSDVIEVNFKPNGPGPSEKTVTIQGNTDPRVHTVKIKAMVE